MAAIFFYLFIAGLVGGFVSGVIGVGGGIIYVVILPEALALIGIPEAEIAQYTIANSLVTIFLASILVNLNHFRTKIYYKELLVIGISSAVTSILCLSLFVNTPSYSLPLFNSITLILLTLLLIYSFIPKRKSIDSSQSANPNSYFLLFVGIMGGLIASFSGLGGGIIVIPLLVYLMGYNFKIASIVSSGVILITSFFSSIYSLLDQPNSKPEMLHWGYIVVPIVATIYVGVICTSGFGVNLSKKLSASQIQIIYTIVLLIVIFKKMLIFL